MYKVVYANLEKFVCKRSIGRSETCLLFICHCASYTVGANLVNKICSQARQRKSLLRDAYCSTMQYLRARVICIWAEKENIASIVKIYSLWMVDDSYDGAQVVFRWQELGCLEDNDRGG